MVPPPRARLLEVPTRRDPPQIHVNATAESEMAVGVLKEFFAAANWKERLRHVQIADQVRDLMEQYYTATPDGPVVIDNIELIPQQNAQRGCEYGIQ